MLQLLQIPYLLFALVWNTLVYMVAFVIGIVAMLAQILAPFVPLALFFVSNDKQAKTVMEAHALPKISTPADGELFSQLFEKNPQVQAMRLEGNKLIVTDPSFNDGAGQPRLVSANLYKINPEEN